MNQPTPRDSAPETRDLEFAPCYLLGRQPGSTLGTGLGVGAGVRVAIGVGVGVGAAIGVGVGAGAGVESMTHIYSQLLL